MVPSVPATSSRRSMPPRKVQLTSNWPSAPDSKRISDDGVVFGLDRVHEGVGPGHDLDRPVVLADEAADDLDAVAAEVDDGAAAGLLLVPEPGAVRAGMGLPGAHPGDVADGAALDGGDRLEGLGGVARGPRGSRRRSRPLRPCRGCAWPLRRCEPAAWCRARPCRRRRSSRSTSSWRKLGRPTTTTSVSGR